jgi:hypothetical protein
LWLAVGWERTAWKDERGRPTVKGSNQELGWFRPFQSCGAQPRLVFSPEFKILRRVVEANKKTMTAPADSNKAAEVVGPVELEDGIQRHNNDDDDDDEYNNNDNAMGEPLRVREWEDAVYRRTAGWHGQDLIHSSTTSPVHVASYRVECTIHSKMYIIAYNENATQNFHSNIVSSF